MPRLGRDAALALVAHHLPSEPAEITSSMPDLRFPVTYSPVGGTRVEQRELEGLRDLLVEIARSHGMPGAVARTSEFEARCAEAMHERVPMTPHEASHEDVWSYLTCCWLLDVAVWRFGAEADERRYIGNVNRNTFRRMWWRKEVLGPDIDLARLGEDELVNIMERPTIASDRRLARAVASEFLRRVDAGEAPERMHVMREAMKRLLRLTPMVAFTSLDDIEVRDIVADTFDAAIGGMNGEPVVPRPHARRAVPQPSPDVVREDQLAVASPGVDSRAPIRGPDFDLVAQAALDIARRTGRVTNIALREVVSIESDEAREVFKDLVERGALVRRGVKRGTYYVLAEPTASGTVRKKARSRQTSEAVVDAELEAAWIAEIDDFFGPDDEASPTDRPTDSALRRLLQRRPT
jgi:hypothetical protein